MRKLRLGEISFATEGHEIIVLTKAVVVQVIYKWAKKHSHSKSFKSVLVEKSRETGGNKKENRRHESLDGIGITMHDGEVPILVARNGIKNKLSIHALEGQRLRQTKTASALSINTELGGVVQRRDRIYFQIIMPKNGFKLEYKRTRRGRTLSASGKMVRKGKKKTSVFSWMPYNSFKH
jgi:hypothetical protein